jgi:pimeloyl-ACP methyl ester carboxylesterase
MDPRRADQEDPAWATVLANRHDDGQGVGAWRALLPAIAADVAAQPLLTPAELRSIEAPTMVVCGDRDPFVPIGQAWELERQLPNGRLFVVPDCGHEVTVRRPGLFNEGLAGFYRGTKGVAMTRAGGAHDDASTATDESVPAAEAAAGQPAPATKEDT